MPAGATQMAIALGTQGPATTLPTVPNLAVRLEQCFDRVRDIWWQIGRQLAELPGGRRAHMPTCSTYASDFGQAAAWALLIRELAGGSETTVVVCRDPWLFREVMGECQVQSAPPSLLRRSLTLKLRGQLARLKLVTRLLAAMRATARSARNHDGADGVLLVYAHPESTPDGNDAYFGDLMNEMPGLRRLVHTDGDAGRARALAADGRTASLHAWGRVRWLPMLLGTRWRLTSLPAEMKFPWLVRRAVAIEAGGASAATNRWQMRCQRAWLETVRPNVVAWPWENHPWERDFVACARKLDVGTVGYQHTVVGRHMYNQSPHANPDGTDELPDVILCNGYAYRDDLRDAGVPENRLAVAGARRQRVGAAVPFDPAGPVFVGLSNDRRFADQMMHAVRRAANAGLGPFLVKDHPMCPYPITPADDIRVTDRPMGSEGGISALIYCTGTIGLEGLLSGIPTYRFLPEGFVAMDILPRGLKARDVDTTTLTEALRSPERPVPVATDKVLAATRADVWCKALARQIAMRQKDAADMNTAESRTDT